jgi:hypothetical protein
MMRLRQIGTLEKEQGTLRRSVGRLQGTMQRLEGEMPAERGENMDFVAEGLALGEISPKRRRYSDQIMRLAYVCYLHGESAYGLLRKGVWARWDCLGVAERSPIAGEVRRSCRGDRVPAPIGRWGRAALR